METTDIFIEPVKVRPLPVVALPMKSCGSKPKTGYRSSVRFWSIRHRGVTNLPAYNTIAQAFSGYLIQKVMLTSQCLPSRIPPITFLAYRHHGGAGSTA